MSYGPLYPLFGAYLIVSVTGSLVLLSRKLGLHSGIERAQLQFVLLGIGTAAIGGSTANLLVPLVFGTSRLNVYGPIFGLLMVAIFAHAIIRYRLLNVQLVVRRGITEVAASLTAGAAFLGVAELVAWLFTLEPQTLPLPVTLLSALVVAQVFQPLRRGVQAALDHYFFRTPYDYPAALREMSRAMSDIVDLRTLFEFTCRAISDTLHAERVALYVGDAGGSEYRLESSFGTDSPTLPGTIWESSVLVQSLLRGGNRMSLVTADVRRRDAGPPSAEMEELNRLGAECVLAVLMHGQFVGFYVIGRKRSGDPYFTEDIDLVSAVASQVGIAIRLHVQIGLAEAEKRRAERLVSFGAVARELAHEIKNPLVAIRTFAELLPERSGDRDFRESFAKIVLQEIARIDQLVARLRSFAAPPIPRFLPVDLPQLLRETLALLRGEIERAKVRVTIAGDRATPVILGDRAQLKQLLLNIFMNALEAVDMGGTISVRLSNPPTHQLILEIEDTGPGVPVEILPNIFEAFVTTKPEGSGLGLAIGRAIANAHHAIMRAENNSGGRGFKITLEFPVPESSAIEPPNGNPAALV